MDMKMEYYPNAYSTSHQESFSSATGSSASFGPFSPVSEQPSPASEARIGSVGSCDFDANTAAGSFTGMPMVPHLETPPPSATMPSFYGLDLQQQQQGHPHHHQTSATVAPHMTNGFLATSEFPQPPATPDRNSNMGSMGSIASHHSGNGSPISPISPQQMLSTYSSSVTTPGSSASAHSQNLLCSTDSPNTYFGELHQHPHQQAAANPYHHHAHQRHPHPAFQHPHQAAAFHHDGAAPSPSYVMPTASPAHSLRGENSNSPTDFMFNIRTDSPIKDYFGERSVNLPPPPPSATLPSSVLTADAYNSPPESAELDRRYSTSSSSTSSYGVPVHMTRQYSRMDNVRRNSEALQRISSRGYDYSSYNNGSTSPTAGGHLMVRNGIRVSRVASGAFKCIVPGCPSRPFKRSEHLKRHVTTHHENKDHFPCEFCGRHFNRKDNWRSHLKLHTVARGKNARTDYFPKAVLVFNEEMRKVSKCRPRKDKDL